MPELAVENVVVHPLVLLSVVDHFNRIGKVGNQKRVVGVLLGSWQKKILDVSNSFAVPFDEDDKDDSVWFLDHDYLENMYGMFKKVNARERIVGWYHTGPKLHKNDIAINELIKQYCTNSVLVIIDVKPKDLGLPTEAYISVEEIHDVGEPWTVSVYGLLLSDGTPTSKTFEHVTSEIGAEEAEEVGVEHLLRDIKDTTVGTLSQRITNQVHGLKGLNSKLLDIRSYLERVVAGKLPINHQIIYQLQDVFNLLPDVNLLEFTKAFYLKTNDQMLVVYLASLIRSVVALHNLINNKISNRDAERKEGQEKEEGKKEKKDDKEKKEEKEKEKGDTTKKDEKKKK
uniref:26S proteasome non-ATPase regulatory subunit 7 n=1 Tax=Myripristis murdjan TaxID=586833 RepID=A0A667X793_9TELE